MALSLTIRMSDDRRLTDLTEFVEIKDNRGKIIRIAVAKASKNKVRMVFDAEKEFNIVRKVLTKET